MTGATTPEQLSMLRDLRRALCLVVSDPHIVGGDPV